MKEHMNAFLSSKTLLKDSSVLKGGREYLMSTCSGKWKQTGLFVQQRIWTRVLWERPHLSGQLLQGCTGYRAAQPQVMP